MLVVSLLVALFFLGSFLWAIKTGQYDDDYTPSVRILFEDDLKSNNQNKNQNGSTKI
jgi:cbb3-type cytochrome oxidase maturation protein